MPTLTVIYRAAKAADFSEFLPPEPELEAELRRTGYSIVERDETSIKMDKTFPDAESINKAADNMEKEWKKLREHFLARKDLQIPQNTEIFPVERHQDDTGTRVTIFITPSPT